MAGTLHRVKVEIAEIRPTIWRRFDIDSDASLDAVHMIIQIGFGWEAFHLHHFEVEGARFSSDTNHDGVTTNSRTVTLGSVAGVGDQIGYVYDYGDLWYHTLTVEKVVTKRGDRPFVRCSHGRRAGPPEDIGGPWGYQELVAAMKSGRGSNYNRWREINGGRFDPAEIDVGEINSDLAHWAKNMTSTDSPD